MSHDPWPPADTLVRAAVQATRTAALDALARWASALGDPWTMVAVALVVAAALVARGARRTAGAVATVPLGAVGAFNAVKALVQRVRPPGALALGEWRWSFPSGHATVVAATSAVIAWALVREGVVRPRAAIGAAATWALLVGASRVWLDAHWASDVVAGWAVGGALAAMGARTATAVAARGAPVPVSHDRTRDQAPAAGAG